MHVGSVPAIGGDRLSAREEQVHRPLTRASAPARREPACIQKRVESPFVRLEAVLSMLPNEALLPVSWLRSQLIGQVDNSPQCTLPTDVTVAIVADELGRADSTVRSWCRTGQLPGAYRLRGREWRIPASALAAFFANQRSGR